MDTLTYYDWEYMPVPGAASMGRLNVDPELLDTLRHGRSVRDGFPADAGFQMLEDKPDDVMLIDNILNRHRIPLVSPIMRTFLEGQEIPDLELLTVGIADHKGRIVADNYSLVHPCRVVDCIDQEQSIFKWNRLNPNSMSPVTKLVFNPDRLAPDDSLIRAKHLEHRILVREDLARSLLEQGFEGMYVKDVNDL